MKIINNKNKIVLVSIFFSLLLVSCEKETKYNVLKGQLTGYISLYDRTTTSLSDKSDIEIIIEGSDSQIKAFTDENGQYIIDDLKTGTYNIIFNKKGYCQYKIISYQFLGGNEPTVVYPITLYSTSNIQINDLNITDLNNRYNVEFRITADIYDPDKNDYSFCRYYLSNEPDVSYTNYVSTNYIACNTGDKGLYKNITIDTLKYPVGSELYLIIYPAAETSQSYTDINTGKKIYTSINKDQPSDIVSITIPEVESIW